jgi:phosphopantothenoylcysteine decarboxylase/phosphopantothenate--cysteine ligase
MSEVPVVLGALRTLLGKDGDLTGKKIVISAGGTHENIDPVRFIGNESSGKMGFATAEAARDRGADVALVSGPSAQPDPYGVKVTRVRSAVQMRDAIVEEVADAQALIMAAAVADYQPAEPVSDKIKREGRETLTLPLMRTPDILAEVAPRPGLLKVGFAAESQDLLANARAKMESKGLDLIVANDITATDAGFSVDTNRVVVIDAQGAQEEWPLMTKYEVGWRILDTILKLAKDRS